MLNNSTCEYNILHVIYIILFPFCLSKCETLIIAVVIRHNLTSNFVENVKSATINCLTDEKHLEATLAYLIPYNA